MPDNRLYNKRKFKRTTRRDISPSAPKDPDEVIINSCDEAGKNAAIIHEHWVFSYLLCNPHWQGTGIFANDFSDVFNSSGSLLDFIIEFQSHTIRTRTKNCFSINRRFRKNELIN